MSSIFSKIVAGEIPSYKIAENDKFFAFLDINPIKGGHTLVIPKEEIDYLFDLDNQLLADMTLFSKNIATAIKKVIPCERVGMMVIGFDVPHAHIHLVPMNNTSDMLTKERAKLTNLEFEEIARKIREAVIL